MSGKTVALVVAAGNGSRSGGDIPKQYRRIGGQAVLAHAVDRLMHPQVDEIRVVIGPGQEDDYRQAVGTRMLAPPVTGGASRQQSVRNGLERIAADGGADRVLIHDAARPFLSSAVIERLGAALDAHHGAVPVLPVADSLAKDEGMLGGPVDREALVRVQTPQAFRFDAILTAHRSWTAGPDATDDAQVARAAGFGVATVAGDRALDKLTYPQDFAEAERRLMGTFSSRTGFGFDVHAFTAGDHLWLGGLRIPHAKALAGHSDADVLLHAVTDALLGAIAEGDIGQHFPPSDPQWKGAPSSRFLAHARDLVDRKGGRIVHVDATVICEAPRVGPWRDAIRNNVAALLNLPEGRVSVKATTTERLGFTGRGEGIAAQAIATVALPDDR